MKNFRELHQRRRKFNKNAWYLLNLSYKDKIVQLIDKIVNEFDIYEEYIKLKFTNNCQ